MIWSLPCALDFLDEVGVSIAGGRHCVLRLPEPLIEGVVDALEDRLGRSADVYWLGDGMYKPEQMADHIDVDDRRLIVLDALRAGMQDSEGWRDLISGASAIAHRANVDRPVLVALAEPSFDAPDVDTYLDHHVWWGRVRGLDVELAVEGALRRQPPPEAADHYWLRAICLGLMGADLRLIERIVERMPQAVDEIIDCLGAPTSLGRERAGMAVDPLGIYDTDARAPPTDAGEVELWRQGLFDARPGRGVQLCPSLLTANSARRTLEDRLRWGQMRVILPLTDQVRLDLLRRLEAHAGADWHKLAPRGALSKRERGDTRRSLGKLARWLRGAREAHPAFAQLAEVAQRWSKVRDTLAHGWLLTYQHFALAMEAFLGL